MFDNGIQGFCRMSYKMYTTQCHRLQIKLWCKWQPLALWHVGNLYIGLYLFLVNTVIPQAQGVWFTKTPSLLLLYNIIGRDRKSWTAKYAVSGQQDQIQMISQASSCKGTAFMTQNEGSMELKHSRRAMQGLLQTFQTPKEAVYVILNIRCLD